MVKGVDNKGAQSVRNAQPPGAGESKKQTLGKSVVVGAAVGGAVLGVPGAIAGAALGAAYDAVTQPASAAGRASGSTKNAAPAAPPPNPLGTSPAGQPYQSTPKVSDSTRIFGPNGQMNRADVVGHLSQVDGASSTASDQDRCGPTAIMASAIMGRGKEGLLDYANAVRGNLADSGKQADVDRILGRIRSGEATYGDLGRLGEHGLDAYGSPDTQRGGRGVLDADLFYSYRDAGMRPPPRTGRPQDIFRNGQSWPVSLDTSGGQNPNHWVVFGKDDRGRGYVYDPMPHQGRSQVAYSGTPEYDAYLRQVQTTGGGFAPINERDAERAANAFM